MIYLLICYTSLFLYINKSEESTLNIYLTNVKTILMPKIKNYKQTWRHCVLGQNQEANYICMPFNHQKLCFVVGK